MAEFRVNIFELTRQIFRVDAYFPKFLGLPSQDKQYQSNIPTIEVADNIGTSVLGTPIFETLRIKIPNTQDEFLEFEDAPIMIVNQLKNVVRTPVQGRKGTVKEYISEQDFRVQIKGLLANHTGEDSPYDKINALGEIAKHTKELEVESRLLNLFGIYNLVILKVTYSESKWPNIQPYTIDAISDEPIELLIDRPAPTASFEASGPGII